ncbi:MAG: preprotein translocase subunit Sec61beta [Candidatus Asgardarchaeia archaeon]
MPAASAGLLRFFEEETPGFRLRPEVIVILAIALILASVLSYIYWMGIS